MKEHYASQAGLRIALAIVFVIGFGPLPHAQSQAPPAKAPMYDSATEVTVQGTVEAVNQLTGRRGAAGTHLELKTEKETLDVHAGPSWFLTKNGITFAKGDQIEVTGSKVKFGTADTLLAREIAMGDKKVVLRNERGFPLWSRGPRR